MFFEVAFNPNCIGGGGAKCALTTEIALKTQKNEKKMTASAYPFCL